MNPKKILVVDDDPIIVRTVTMKLQADGYTVLAAPDGQEAVSIVRCDNPDLILLDINFPPDASSLNWDGFQVIEWLNRINESVRIPIVIIITGEDSDRLRDRARAAGAVGFFQKPIDHAAMGKLIREVLAEKDAASPTSA